MESFFHGKFSRPLKQLFEFTTAYQLQGAYWAHGNPFTNPEGKGAVFLLDSGATGETAPMVEILWRTKVQFSRMMQEQFTRYTDACVEDFLVPILKACFKM